MKKIVGAALFIFWAIVVALLISGLVYYENNKNSNSESGKQVSANTGVVLTMNEISKHNSANDCWLLIGDKVYDTTNYLGKHPGGAAMIIPYCGKDASQAFATKDTNTPHSASANSLLADFYIGDLNQKIGLLSNASKPILASDPAASATAPAASAAPAPQVTLNAGEVAKHNTISDCWMIYSGNVYNLTNYFGAHPGGNAEIASYCGKDGTAAFNTIGHSANAKSLLAKYYIGGLNQKTDAGQIQQNVQNTNIITPSAPVNTRKDDDDDDD